MCTLVRYNQVRSRRLTIKRKFYDLWFILEGRGANRGIVLSAYYKCEGGRDGGCKHIAAAMYSLEDWLNTQGEESVTSGLCQWIRNSLVNVKPCEVKDLVNTKDKVVPIVKAKRRPFQWLQEKDFDLRQCKKPATDQEIASRMSPLNTASPIIPGSLFLFLFKRCGYLVLFLHSPQAHLFLATMIAIL